MHSKNWYRREICLTVAGAIVTVISTVLYFNHLSGVAANSIGADRYWGVLVVAIFAAVMVAFAYGNLVYLLTRIGNLQRQGQHSPASDDELHKIYDKDAPSLAVLVPSYKEDEHIVRQTLLSAALMEYPNKRIVLLIDDPPNPSCLDAVRTLQQMRRLPEQLQEMLAPKSSELRDQLDQFLDRMHRGPINVPDELQRLAQLFDDAAQSFAAWGDEWVVRSHVDRFFVDRVFRDPAARHRARAEQLRLVAHSNAASLEEDGLLREYRRLAGFFDAQLCCFERKRFENLSQEANKAMNLNSYLALMGKSWSIGYDDDGRHLEQCPEKEADLVVPGADYIITLDADSILLNDYSLRLISKMEAPGNERVAIVQTPYLAFPGATNLLERVAGATTDIYHMVHQGFTRFGATYWVGANALIRREALDDIATTKLERGYPITCYIQDRTVIEDTESSIDLAVNSWTLYNYPDRLAFSATPPDFGSLLIQRRRWANGGLIILPKLLRHYAAHPFGISRFLEALVRVHYLVAAAVTSVSLLVLLILPFEEGMASMWLPLAAAPYFLLYGRDLARSGYGWSDLARVYALNLLLIPVNLGGAMKSVQQAVTGRKTPFGRTPKIDSRTSVPPLYIVSVLALLVCCIINTYIGFDNGHAARFTVSFLNALAMAYVVINYIGLRECLEDLTQHMPSVPVSVAMRYPAFRRYRPSFRSRALRLIRVRSR